MLRALVFVVCSFSAGGCRGERPAEIEVEIHRVTIDPSSRVPVVILADRAGRRGLPIWIGPSEAQAITMEMEGVESPRPLTHDLIKDLLDSVGVEFRRVLIPWERKIFFISV